MHKIFMPDYCKTIIKSLEDKGFEAYLVGGCVRDSVMGITPHDYDITTSATPDEMLECFSDFKVIETGVKHGTLTVVIDENQIEVTTFRIDGEYTDFRRPNSVSFSRDLEEDLSRRDFTINALAYNEKTGIVDMFGGLEDIKNEKIRCVGEPDKRFFEDALRILRALRFSSTLDFEIEKDTAKSILKNQELIKNIAVERVFVEFKKLLCGKRVEQVLLEFRDVFAQFIPEIKPCFDFEQKTKYHCYDVYTHIVKTVANIKADEKLRLTAFFHDIGKPQTFFSDENGVGHFYGHNKNSSRIAKQVLKRLKADNKTVEDVATNVYIHDREVSLTEKSVKRFLSKYSLQSFYDLLEIKKADALAHAKEYRDRTDYLQTLYDLSSKIINEKQCFNLKDLALNGYDLINLGYSGKCVGEALEFLLGEVIDGKVQNEKESLIKHLKDNRR